MIEIIKFYANDWSESDKVKAFLKRIASAITFFKSIQIVFTIFNNVGI